MNVAHASIAELLGKKLKGFEVRESQQAMFEAILEAYQEKKIALIEAGTGTGKSLAYLIPALFWAQEQGESTVIATNTIALQEQLMTKDIPFLLNALGLNLKVVLVKGMNNYLCLRKLADAQVERSLFDENEKHEFAAIEEAVPKMQEGSRSELAQVPSFEAWERVGAEAESCTHAKCPFFKECFFFKARREAAEAHILIANHHLLFADLSIRAETDKGILPPFRRLIIDEAHHVEDIATEYFAKRASRLGMIRQLGRLLSEKNTGKLLALRKKIRESIPEEKMDIALTRLCQKIETELPALKRQTVERLHAAFDALRDFFSFTAPPTGDEENKLRIREEHLQHPLWRDDVLGSLNALVEIMRPFLQSIHSLEKDFESSELLQKCEGILSDLKGIVSQLEGALNAFCDFVMAPEDPGKVRWIEVSLSKRGNNIHLISASLDISSILSEVLFTPFSTVVLCSATLTIQKDFQFIRKRLGIAPASPPIERIYPSPFDYEKQVLLAVPLDLPDPARAEYPMLASEMIWDAIEASQGNAFVLFTSYQMLRSTHHFLHRRLQANGYPLLCQGEENRITLLNRFKNTKRAVLFGTDSFWEGVDVIGDALRCVILAKLPFKVPTEPLIQARCEALLQEGKDPFMDYTLPHAIMKFKQGFGRLIRHRNDRGCVLCLDTRLVKKGYGKRFLKSLPPCQQYFDSAKNISVRFKQFYELAASSDTTGA